MRFLIFLFVAGLLGNLPSARAADPSQRWHTLETPHFYVHYYDNIRHDLSDAAQEVAHWAEKAHATLQPLLQHAPTSRTHIVLSDETDNMGGSAQIVPLNVLRLSLAGPGSLSPLNDYDQWLYLLIIHEYAHVLHIDNIRGLAWLVNAVLGKTWAPNQIQPRWFTEGLATYYESAETSGGRIRSTLYDMYLRAATLEGRWLGFDQVSSDTRYFPRGAVPYLYGGRLLHYLVQRFGKDKLGALSHDYSLKPIPYALNRSAQNVLGVSYEQLYKDFQTHLEVRYAAQQGAATKRGLTEYRQITDHGEKTAHPRLSWDGRELAFVEADGHTHPRLTILDTQTDRVVAQYRTHGTAVADFSPDRRFLVYDEAVNWRTFYHYHDLYVRDRVSGEVRQLTDGLRARHPAVSPDGRVVAFVTNELGSNHLATIPFIGGTPRVLVRGSDGDQVFTPRWSPDGQHITYSRWRAGGYRDIYIIHVATGRTRRITADRALDIDPMYARDGRRLYFSSDRTGIFNMYCYELATGRLQQVSNVIGGSFSPAVMPDEDAAYYVGFSAKGYDLHKMPLDAAKYLAALPLEDRRPPPPEQPTAPVRFPPRGYNPLQTIWPYRWRLHVGSTGPGARVGVALDGTDVVGIHSWRARVDVATNDGAISYDLGYRYTRFWPSFSIFTNRSEGNRGGLFIDGVSLTYHEENFGAGLTIGLPVLRMPDHSVNISLGYRFNYFRDADHNVTFTVPGELVTVLPETGILSGVTASISYSNVHVFAFSVSRTTGRAISLTLRVDDEVFGSDYGNTALSWAWAEYIGLPWFESHVLALRYAGGIAQGSFARRGGFAIGGFPEQNVLQAVVNQAPLGGTYLRGYDPGFVVGDQFHLLNIEYRFPLWDIERGISLIPLYFSRIHAAAFSDIGDAFVGELQPENLKVGVGGEILIDWIIGYYVHLMFRFGYAYGFMEGGGHRFHFLLGNRF